MSLNFFELPTALWAAFCIGCLAMAALSNGTEIGIYTADPLRLSLESHRGNPRARRLHRLMADRPGLLFVTLLNTNLANYLASVSLTLLLLARGATGAQAELLAALMLTPTVLLLVEMLPKVLFQRHAMTLLLNVTPQIAAAHKLVELSGLLWLNRRLTRLATRLRRRSPGTAASLHSRLAVYQALREGAEHGTLTRTQAQMLDRIHALRTTTVAASMVPRRDVTLLPADAPASQIERTLQQAPFSRLPVFQGDRRRVVGILHILDRLVGSAAAIDLARLEKPLELAPQTTVLDALTLMQQGRRRMAVVVNADGDCLGIVTVKDLVEEIVGELAAW